MLHTSSFATKPELEPEPENPNKKDHLDPEAREAARAEAARLTKLIISHAARASRLKGSRRPGLRGLAGSSSEQGSFFIYNHDEVEEEEEEEEEEDFCSWHSTS